VTKTKITVIALVLLSVGAAWAHDPETAVVVSAENYARAEQWLRHKVKEMVKNVFVTPHWIGDTDSFWYKRETQEGHEFMVVDAATGAKRPAFDHELMATSLTLHGVEAEAAELPFETIEYTEDQTAITFEVGDTRYRCSLDSLKCELAPGPYDPPGLLVSPDRKWAVLTRDGNLWKHDMATGAESRLTENGEENFGYGIQYGNWKARSIPNSRAGTPLAPLASEWSPDSSKVLVTRIDQRHVAEYAWLETVPDDGSFRPKVHTARIPLTGEQPAGVEWFVFDVSSGEKARLDLPYDKLFHVHQDMLALREFWWSDDSSHLYTIGWGGYIESAYLFDIDTSTGEVRTVVEESMTPRMDTNSTSYNPPNVRVIGDCDEVIWFSQRSGWGHLYLYDGDTGALLNPITSGDWLVRDIIHVDEDKRQVYFTAGGREPGSPYDRYLYRVNFDGSELTLLSPEKADHMLTAPFNDILAIDGALGHEAVSPSGKYVVYNYSRVDQATKSVIRTTADGALVATFEECDASALYEAGWRNPVEFTAKAADGETDLYGLMYLPPKLDETQEYPVVDSQYASPLTAVVPRNFMMAIQGVPALVRPACLSELGFVSVTVDARGTTYRSKEFSHYSWQNLNTIGLEDHVAAIEQLGERHPWMDTDRVGIHGGSYGGWTAFRAMFEFPEFFKVGVSGAGMGAIHDMYPDYHWAAYHGRPVYADGGYLKRGPTDKPVNSENADGSVQAANLQGKLLITLGELDENVFPTTTLAVVDALIKLDKDFDMYYYPNQPHVFRAPFSVRKVWDYLVRHLHGQEPPEYHIEAWEQ
jgi:dipeptidyl aminopeptidase/acylaminoacyl peptidase